MSDPSAAEATVALIEADAATAPAKDEAATGRSPLQLALVRFRRDRLGKTALGVVLFFLVIAALAPVIAKVYGKNPNEHYGQDVSGLLTDSGMPVKPNGGISGDFWLGIEPGLGRDVFTQLLYGMRTSLIVAISTVIITTLIAIAVGITVGYLSGLPDKVFVFVSNVMMAFPFLLLMIAMTPVIDSHLVASDEARPAWLQFTSIILVLSIFGWIGHALTLRTLVRSLREREFVQAAKAMGMSRRKIIFGELLPNLWAPIIVHITLAVPSYVTAEAALSYLGVGIDEPIPDWGRMILRGSQVMYSVPTYMFFPGVTILVFVLAFNLLGDSVRDALDPKTSG